MPIYEYRCTSCGHKFERIEPIGDRRVRECPRCGESAHRQISRAGFILKGNGWYVTEHPSPERKKAMADERRADSGAVSSSASGSGSGGAAGSSSSAAKSAGGSTTGGK